jgi:hypothetical protein
MALVPRMQLFPFWSQVTSGVLLMTSAQVGDPVTVCPLLAPLMPLAPPSTITAYWCPRVQYPLLGEMLSDIAPFGAAAVVMFTALYGSGLLVSVMSNTARLPPVAKVKSWIELRVDRLVEEHRRRRLHREPVELVQVVPVELVLGVRPAGLRRMQADVGVPAGVEEDQIIGKRDDAVGGVELGLHVLGGVVRPDRNVRAARGERRRERQKQQPLHLETPSARVIRAAATDSEIRGRL